MKQSIRPSNDGLTEGTLANPKHGKRRNTSKPAEEITGYSSERRASKPGISPGPTRVPITRHVKIRGEANPYDPQWESYFEKRLDVRMEATLKGKRWLLTLWKEQRGLCPVCNQKITKITGWHSHHILWRSKGGIRPSGKPCPSSSHLPSTSS